MPACAACGQANPEAHAHAAGDEVFAAEMRARSQGALFFGPAHIDEAVRVGETRVAEAEGHPLSAPMAGGMLGRALPVRGVPTGAVSWSGRPTRPFARPGCW